MAFETFSADGLNQLTQALIALGFGKFIVDGLFVYLEQSLSDEQFETLIGECGYEAIFSGQNR
jgi:hypothetical protein